MEHPVSLFFHFIKLAQIQSHIYMYRYTCTYIYKHTHNIYICVAVYLWKCFTQIASFNIGDSSELYQQQILTK